eukprot:Amastigsp_a512093_36.p4 type:complete len:129 gc:universal Amastigsp_a512093_36:511-125(-)
MASAQRPANALLSTAASPTPRACASRTTKACSASRWISKAPASSSIAWCSKTSICRSATTLPSAQSPATSTTRTTSTPSTSWPWGGPTLCRTAQSRTGSQQSKTRTQTPPGRPKRSVAATARRRSGLF